MLRNRMISSMMLSAINLHPMRLFLTGLRNSMRNSRALLKSEAVSGFWQTNYSHHRVGYICTIPLVEQKTVTACWYIGIWYIPRLPKIG